MEQNIFPYRGKQITINSGGVSARDIIEVTYPDSTNRYVYQINKIMEMDKIAARVIIQYRKTIYDFDDAVIFDKADLEFNAATQETMGYFYALMNTVSFGKSLDQMTVDGLLIYEFGLQQGVFGSDGGFYYPISFDCTIAPIGGDIKSAVTVSISDPIEGESYTYTVLEKSLSQASNTFELEPGTYTIVAESVNSMSYVQTIRI